MSSWAFFSPASCAATWKRPSSVWQGESFFITEWVVCGKKRTSASSIRACFLLCIVQTLWKSFASPVEKHKVVSLRVVGLLNYWFLSSWINVGILDFYLSYSSLENNATCIKIFIVFLWKTWAGAEWQNRVSQLCFWQPGFVDLETLWTLGSAFCLHLLGSWRT